MSPLVLNLDLLDGYNAGVVAAVAANRARDEHEREVAAVVAGKCPVTVHSASSGKSRRCRRPPMPGVRFCAKHEADRVRLGGAV